MQEGEAGAEPDAPAADGGEEARSVVPVIRVVEDVSADGGADGRGTTQSEALHIAQIENAPAAVADGNDD